MSRSDDLPLSSDSSISMRLAEAGPFAFSAYCIIAAFGTYFCMYGFRKPFTAATYADTQWLGIGFKTILIAAQVAGYTLSKFIGIKIVSEMRPRYRAVSILVLIAIAETALFLFAVTPVPWNFIWLFVNGLPLGMVFGLVLGFLEGRKVTEALSAGLCASFIVSSGFVKTVGRSLIQDYQVDPYWMPFLSGLLFVFPLLLFVSLLSQIPPPTAMDEASRSKRAPMGRMDRHAFFRRHAAGMIGLLSIYVLLTIVRSMRDDFAVEVWQELGVDDKPNVFARSEFWVMIGVVMINGCAFLLKNNRLAFLSSIALLCVGFSIVLLAVAGQRSGALSPMVFMVLLGTGMYIPYVAFHTTVFERMLAAFREPGTIGYLMYLADAIGYLGYVAVMVFRNTVSGEVSFLGLLLWASVLVAVASSIISVLLGIHYHRTLPDS
ncbi:hypothetical protein FYK55_25945 [Roseiconus nitratireducens]|uniref:MFS transporter n=1 Tax=Roseiconus nitratireducens TaxID=2605748 RepID=A0A5M6CY10_9BACT|nr:DUF5690 family protein [Roseiconus nitratireducens]KAA5538882.1 hypothetical protein FYK55_25945 [Roseiconus nitratireducens]